MTVRVRYEDPDSGQVTEIQQQISQSQFARTFDATSPTFQLDAVVAEYAEILRDSYWAKDSDLLSVALEARRIAEYMPQDEDVQEFTALVWQAAGMMENEG